MVAAIHTGVRSSTPRPISAPTPNKMNMPGNRMPIRTSDSNRATSNTVMKPQPGWACSQFSSSWVQALSTILPVRSAYL